MASFSDVKNALSLEGQKRKLLPFPDEGDRRPAMLISFINAADELTGIQCTYLDKETGNKDKKIKIGKCSIGQICGSAGVIHRGGSDKVIVGEGAETARSGITPLVARLEAIKNSKLTTTMY